MTVSFFETFFQSWNSKEFLLQGIYEHLTFKYVLAIFGKHSINVSLNFFYW